MEKSCNNCINFNVCKLRIDSMELFKGFIDFDKPYGAEWISSYWKLIAERCLHYKNQNKD